MGPPEIKRTGLIDDETGSRTLLGSGNNTENSPTDDESVLPDYVLSIAALVPVFTAPPSADGTDNYRRPNNWQQLTTDDNAERLAEWQPGDAIMALCGDLFVVIDVDPQNGGDCEAVRAWLIELGIRIFAEVATPGGGRHFIVAGHIDIPTIHLPGIDVLSYGANVFLPGTRRAKYGGRGYEVISDDLAALIDGGDEDGAESLAGWIAERQAPESEEPPSPLWNGAKLNTRQREYLTKALKSEAARLAVVTLSRNIALNTAAFRMGQFVAGAGLDAEAVYTALLKACETNGLLGEDGLGQTRATMRSGMLSGALQPRAVPPAMSALELIGRVDDGRRSAVVDVSAIAPKMTARLASEMPIPPSPKWLAVGWLPLSSVTVLAGDEGIGKSLLWVLMVAHITTGRALLEIGLPAREPRDVIVVITEDPWAEVRARLLLAGADLRYVTVVSEESDGTGSPVFPDDLSVITERADSELIDLALIVLDAWLDTVASGIQVRDTQQARTALHPWKEMAGKYECAVLLVVTTNRMTDASTRDRVGATGALRQKARVLLFAAAEKDGEGAQLFVGPDKANGTGRNHAVRFDINVSHERPATIDDPGTVAQLSRPVEQAERIGTLIAQWRATEKEAMKPPTADERVETWLRTFMSQHNGEVLTEILHKAGQVEGHTPRRITQVLKAIGGVSSAREPGGKWISRLSADQSC